MEIEFLDAATNTDIYAYVWAMFNVTQVCDNYQIHPITFLKFIVETDR